MTTPLHPRSLPGVDSYADEPPPPYEESPSSLSSSSSPPPPFVTTYPQNPPSRQPRYQPLAPPPLYSPSPPSSSSRTAITTTTTTTTIATTSSSRTRTTTSTTTTTHQTSPLKKVGFLPQGEEKSLLETLLSQHRWKAYYGPKPKTLTAALRKAALWGDRAFVRAILDVGGAEIGGGQQHSNTCVHEALRGPSPDIALEILRRYMDVDDQRQQQQQQQQPQSSVQGQTSCTNRHQWILDSRDSATGVMPLHVAAESGDARVVLALVEMGAQVDAVDGVGRTALHMAARYRKLEVVDVLLDCGAEVGRVKRSLWDKWKEGSKERELLGGWEVVSGVLRDAVERRRALGLGYGGSVVGEGQDEAEEEEEEDVGLAMDEEEEEEEDVAVIQTVGGGVTDISLGQDILYRNVVGNSAGTASRPSPETGNLNWQLIQAALLASNLSETADPPVRRVLRVGGGMHSRTAHQSFLHSPEYEAWRADCEVLLAESRRQRERNRQENERRLGVQASRISTHGSTYIR
ncbi:ankyrin repeat-containing domain protein [Cladorrhinum samala]|uniref:Ankyrin repeat-containing domain protein n=1 Tax=Cladorrhinum samala TaxID=585594 RepID=A0AAV9HUE4_9PEZI|nr:ankyrin repeat-containing domain protein [Cladorrhinum samala]